jgi:hypothetical protein
MSTTISSSRTRTCPARLTWVATALAGDQIFKSLFFMALLPACGGYSLRHTFMSFCCAIVSAACPVVVRVSRCYTRWYAACADRGNMQIVLRAKVLTAGAGRCRMC